MEASSTGYCPWLALVFGDKRSEIDKELAIDFVNRLCNELDGKKFILDAKPLRDIRLFFDANELVKVVAECIEEKGKEQLILLILIDNGFVSEVPIGRNIQQQFSSNVVIFCVLEHDVINSQQPGNSFIRDECSAFLDRCPDYVIAKLNTGARSITENHGDQASNDIRQVERISDVVVHADESLPHLLSPDTLALASSYLKKYPANNDAVVCLCTDEAFNRLMEPFQYFEDNMTFLNVLSRSISSCHDDVKTKSYRDKLIMQILDERFMSRVCSKYSNCLSNGNDLHEFKDKIVSLLEHLMDALIAVSEVITSSRKTLMLDDWNLFRELWEFLESKEFFTEKFLKLVMMNRLEFKNHTLIAFFTGSPPPPKSIGAKYLVDTSTFVKQQTSIHDQRSVPFWQRAEHRSPPEDFRTLTTIPTRSDLKIAKDHYIRRALILEPYNDSNHYLDILFRLMREDLVSPLRDGLAIHMVSGLSQQGKFDANGLVNDLAVYGVKDMGGAQVDFRHGHIFRYCELVLQSQGKWTENVAAYGQLLCLSLDGFVEDIHLAIVVERNEGKIGLMFPVESGIKKGEAYTVAEPKSYLEAYRYVLDAVKNVSRFRPIPFERYLVHAKEDVRQPLYMRITRSQSEIDEEAGFETYYTEIRSTEKTRRLRLQPDTEPTLHLDRIRNRRKSKSAVIDELEEPMFPKRPNVANSSALEVISIGGITYKIADLEQKYLPDGFDASQRLAMIGALTKELTIIQGPPGTGKTFLGVKIVNTLFENRDRFNNARPILLVCYTNTAVDQFLERVHRELSSNPFLNHSRDVLSQDNYALPTIVRIGSKCSSELLLRENRQINDVVAYHKNALAQEEESNYGSLMKDKRIIAKKIADCAVLIQSTRRLVSYESLQSVIPEKFRLELAAILYRYLDSSGKQMNVDEALACWLLDRTFGNDVNPTMSSLFSNKNNDILKEQLDQFSDDDNEDEILNKLLEELNVDDSTKVSDGSDLADEETLYETVEPWDLLAQEPGSANRCLLFGNRFKRQRDQSSVPLDKNIVEAVEQVAEEVIQARALSDEELADIRSIQSLTRPKRWQLYATWIRDLKRDIRKTLPTQIEMFKKVAQDVLEARVQLQAAVLKDSLIIGATTTGAAKNRKLLEKIGCKILIVEEAAEILEGHTLACILPSVEHTILIGDHQQLRPLPSVQALAKDYRLDISLFERLVKLGIPYHTLEKQHRMNTDVTNVIVRPHFYKSIRDHESVLEYPAVQGVKKKLFFWTHAQKEERPFPGSLSYQNSYETDMAICLADYLIKQGVYSASDITIIAMYGAQVELLRRESIIRLGVLKEDVPKVAVETVDSFQGQENKIVIVSLVRSCGPGIGFLATSNRITVALTRAKHGLFIVGNIEHLSQHSNLWREIYSSLYNNDAVNYRLPIQCKTHGKSQEIGDPSQFEKLAPAGGCNESCGQRLPCGHICPSRCHAVDYHDVISCLDHCERKCERGHVCPRTCSEPCGACEITICQKLECGHYVNVSCYKADIAVCEANCENILECGHKCASSCGKSCTVECKKVVDVTLASCNHTVGVACFRKNTATCDYPCNNILPECGHLCQELCSLPCTSNCNETVTVRLDSCDHVQKFKCGDKERKCAEPVRQKFDRCGHAGTLRCHLGNDSAYCQSTCSEQLPCGHTCQNQCGQCYSDNAHRCRMSCAIKLPCGHSCGARCGAECKCASLCISSCKHLSCGGDITKKMVFRRRCSQSCVLCWKPCDNVCQHRSCTLKCFEECNVSFCNEPCAKKLGCGHACLGVCGEDCPGLCGLCDRENYKKVVSLLGEDVSVRRVHRLVQLPACRHVFPVEYLDEVVLKFRKKNIWPCCPGIDGEMCGQPISSFRYSKIMKSLTLHFTKVNETLINNALLTDKSRLIDRLTRSLSSLDRYASRRGGFHNRASQLIKTIYNVLPSFQRADGDSMIFWHHFFGCIAATSNLLAAYFEISIPKKMRDPQGLNDLYCSVFERESSQTIIENILDDLLQWLNQSNDVQLVGYFMPRARFLFYRACFFITIGHMSGLVKTSSYSDLTAPQSVELQSIARDFLSCNEASDYQRHYINLYNLIRRMFGENASIMKQWKPFEMLEMENF